MEHIELAPLRFTPYLKSVIWGGNKLCSLKGMTQTTDKIGESWELSAVPGHLSIVESGVYSGMTIKDLIDRFGAQLLGSRVYERYEGKFPLLVKLIDAHENLSVQVHPNDELAGRKHNSLGKTEMWYILASDKDAKIYAGLNRTITLDEYERKVTDGTFTDVLATHSSLPGDVFFLPAGRVHAIGAGNLLAEIQQSSDVTYRIFDYNRRDTTGNTRELHTELAKEAIDFTVHEDYKAVTPSNEIFHAELVTCKHFRVGREIIKGEAELNFSPESFTIIMCIDGGATIEYGNGEIGISTVQTVLLPAVLSKVRFRGTATILVAQA